MRISLWTDPRVKRVSRVTQKSLSSVTGSLFRLWSLADEHTEDGFLNGYTAEDIDQEVGIKGFCEALKDPQVGWLVIEEDSLQVVDFHVHGGTSGKRRARDQKRQKRVRKKSLSSVTSVTQKSFRSVTREEKRREERKHPPTPSGGESRVCVLSSVWERAQKQAKEVPGIDNPAAYCSSVRKRFLEQEGRDPEPGELFPWFNPHGSSPLLSEKGSAGDWMRAKTEDALAGCDRAQEEAVPLAEVSEMLSNRKRGQPSGKTK